ncbi:MAG TPA: outer membrane beta-barrel protein, partial [Chitinophagaceae bacterium]|nr:outer membrane beta-barrel protein [Chitinophagaceae bacterium]
EGTYQLIISQEAYIPLQRTTMVTRVKPKVQLGTLTLDKNIKTLSEVVVTSNIPIVVKGDTVQFNAGSIRTRPNASAEELLKKIPGMEVDREGNVKSQGEQVQKVLVDGQEFFGNDPKLATKNLTAEMIESVQVFDDMSDQAKFTKMDDGKRNKTLNIKLKKDRNKGHFTKILAAYGDEGHYEGNLSINKFDGLQRFSLLFNTNNINKPGFSYTDIIGSMGGFTGSGNNYGNDGGMQMMAMRGAGIISPGVFTGGNNGLIKSLSTGLNFSDQWGSKIKVSGSYFYLNSNTDQEEAVFRQTTFIDSVVSTSKGTSSNYKNQNHRLNLRLEYQVDSMNAFLYTSSLIRQNSEGFIQDSSVSFSKIPGQEYLSVNGQSLNENERIGTNWGNSLLYRHKFRKMGRTITLGWNSSRGQSETEGRSLSQNEFYRPDTSLEQSLNQNQQNFQDIKSLNNVFSGSYTEPIGMNKLLELNYAYTNNVNSSNRGTNNYDSISGKYDEPNLQLTNEFENTFLAHRYGLNFRMKQKTYNFQLGLGYQRATLESQSYQASTGKDTLITAEYADFFPTVNLNFTPRRGKNFRIFYNGRTLQPSISQMQDVEDLTDRLNVKTGNPDLKQEFNHHVNINYNSFDVMTFKFIAYNLSLNTTRNRIVNSIDSMGSGIQLTKPENMNGYFRGFSFFTLGLPFKNSNMRGSGFTITNSIAYTRDVSLLYKKVNIGNILSINQGIGLNISKGILDFGVKGNLALTRVNYSARSFEDVEYFTQTYSADFSLNFNYFIISSD